MPYTKNTWSTGDAISAAKLNNIENGVAAAQLTPTTGTASATTFLRGDGAWATPASGGGGSTASNVSVDITNAPYSADKTGAASSKAALLSAISAVSALGGGIVRFPAGTYKIDIQDADQAGTDTSIVIPANVVLEGVGSTSIINFTCTIDSGYCFLFKFSGTNPGIKNLKIQRGSNLRGGMLFTGTSNGASLVNVELDGKWTGYAKDTDPGWYIHGLFLGAGTLVDFVWTGGKAHDLTYPLLQSSPSTGSTKGFLVDGVEFYANNATDLEFNAPHSDMSGIEVRSCYFHDQRTTSTNGGWFAIGLARVYDSWIHHNKVENYRGEPIHIEDGSHNIWVESNEFRACALAPGSISYTQVISSSYRIWILNNDYDMTANNAVPNYPYAIGLQAGGTGTTDGGNGFFPPYEVHVRGNHFHTYTASGIYIEGNARTTIADNRFKGTGNFDSSGYIGTNAGWGVDPVNGDGVIITGNDFEGVAYPIRPRRNGDGPSGVTGSQSGIFSNNRISKAKVGMALINPERIQVTGNTVSRAEYPIITGQGAGVSQPMSIVGNSAQDCRWPLNIAGKYTIVAKAAASIGTGVTITVEGTYLVIPSGVAFTFPNGAIFTTNAASVIGATTLTGNVTVAAIVNGAGGTSATGSIPHSTTSANNHILAANNLDTVAGIYI